jgi:Flp pilus assembly protein TadD
MRAMAHTVVCGMVLLAGAHAADNASTALMGEGLRQLERAQFEPASESFRRALALDPGLAIAYYDLGVCEFSLGRFTEARTAFEESARRNPGHRFTSYFLARLDLMEGKLDPAIRTLRELSKSPAADELYYLASAQFRKGDVQAAIGTLRQAIERQPQDHRAHYLLARAYRKAGRVEDAGREFERSEQIRAENGRKARDIGACGDALKSLRPDAAMARCRELLDGSDPTKLVSLGVALGERELYQAAIEPLAKASSLDPEDFEPAYNLGLTYFRMKQYGNARKPLETAAALRPESYEAVALLGSVCFALGDDYAALEHLRHAHQLRPDDARVAGLLLEQLKIVSKHLISTKEYDKAIVYLEEAAALSSGRERAFFHNLAGFCHLQAGRRQQAADQFGKAIELDPDLKPAHNNLGGLFLLDGRAADAAREFSAVLRLDSSDSQAYVNLARAELASAQIGPALDHLRKAYYLSPGSLETGLALARGYLFAQKPRDALDVLDKLSPAAANSAEWHELRGYAAYKTGDAARAVTEIQKALDLDPRNQTYVLELSEVLIANNNGEAAITLLSAADKMFPNSSAIWFSMGVAYLVSEDRPQAVSALRHSLDLDPKLDSAYAVLGQNYKEAGQWQELLSVSRDLIRANPRNYAGYYYEALALSNTAGNTSEIERLLHTAAAMSSDDAAPHYELAKALTRRGDKDNALRELETAVKVNPDFGPAYYQLYRLYQEKGETEKGREAQLAHARIRQQERDQVTRKLLVEVRRRSGSL